EGEKECEDGEAHATHGNLHQKYAIRRPAQIAPSHSTSEVSAGAFAAPGASPRQRSICRHGPACAITTLTSAAAISNALAWNAGCFTTCHASAETSQNPMQTASTKPARDSGSNNCAIGWIPIPPPRPSI